MMIILVYISLSVLLPYPSVHLDTSHFPCCSICIRSPVSHVVIRGTTFICLHARQSSQRPRCGAVWILGGAVCLMTSCGVVR